MEAQCHKKDHNGGLRPVSTSSLPHKLSRPLPAPMHPSLVSGSSSSSVTPFGPSFEAPPSFLFKKPVPPGWEADYNAQVEARNQRSAANRDRLENERKIKASVNIMFYRKVRLQL